MGVLCVHHCHLQGCVQDGQFGDWLLIRFTAGEKAKAAAAGVVAQRTD